MKDCISPFVFEFLEELKFNNNRDWFIANKSRWDAVRADFLDFVDGIIPEIYGMDKTVGMQSAKDCMYRIYRDIRFSPDKTPYKTHLAAYIASGGVKQHGRPGYYIHIQDGCSSIGGGIFMPSPELLYEIRSEIFYNTNAFKAIIGNPNFRKFYPELWNIESLKKAPKGFPADFPDIDLLKYKHYVSSAGFSNETATSAGFHDFIMERIKATYPLNKFIIDVMYGLQNK